MSAAVFALVVLLALIVGTCIGAYFYAPLNDAWHAAKRRLRTRSEVRAARARQNRYIRSLRKVPALQRHTGHHRAGAALVVPGHTVGDDLARQHATGLLTSEQVTAHADAVHRAIEPYYLQEFPPEPQGQHPYQPTSARVDLPAKRALVEGHPPWTGSQPVLTPEAEAELMRQRRIQEQIDARGPDVTAADLREILDALREPVHGERCEADVRAAEAGAQMAAGWLT